VSLRRFAQDSFATKQDDQKARGKKRVRVQDTLRGRK